MSNHKKQNNPSIPSFTIEDLAKNNVHFGHRKGARNPKMLPYIYGEANGIHIIDMRQSYLAITKALEVLFEAAKAGKRILFVNTNQKFAEQVRKVATDCGQYYVQKWLGGTLTNWRMGVASINKLKSYNKQLELAKSQEGDNDSSAYTKKEIIKLAARRDKLYRYFEGRMDMGGMPDVIVVMSVKSERLAIEEANCIGTPVIGIADTNSDPTSVKYPIPGNDDSLRAMQFYCDMFAKTILAGTKEWMERQGMSKRSKEIEDAVTKITLEPFIPVVIGSQETSVQQTSSISESIDVAVAP